MSKHRWRLNAAALSVFATLTGGVFAVPAAAEKITIMVGGLNKQIYLPAKLAEQLGYFKEEGLNIELLTTPSGVEAKTELLAGNVQGVVGFYDHCIDLQAKGKFVMSVVQLSQAPGEVLLVSSKHPEIKSPANFKGKQVGVTGLGSSTAFLTQFLAVKHGVKLAEFKTVPVGAGNTFIAAMQQNRIHAGMTTEPTISRMLKTDEAKILVDLRTIEKTKEALGGTYPGASLYMKSSWVEAHKAETQKLANAFVKTLRYIASHSAEDITDKMPREYLVGDRESYVKALADGKVMFTPDGVMPAGGPETVLAVLSGFSKNVRGRTIDLSKTFTTEFVEKAK